METAGARGGNQVQTFQTRVRDALRRRLRWRWDRDGSARPRHDTNGSESATKRWPHFSPTAVRKLRFSGETNHASDDRAGTGLNNDLGDLAPTKKNQRSGKQRSSRLEMVNTKTEEKKVVEKEKAVCSGNGRPQHSEVPSTNQTEELNSVAKVKDVIHSELTQTNTKIPNHNVSTSRTNLAKASDDSKRVSLCIESECCKSDSVLTTNIEEHEQDTDVSSSKCPKDIDKVQTEASSNETSETKIFKSIKSELSKHIKEDFHKSSEFQAIAPSIEINEMDVKHLPVQNSKNKRKLPEPFCLSLEPGRTSPSLTRKSPVTVQEWVDSIPLTSQIVQDLDSGKATVSEESQADVCPSVTIQPALSQSGSTADRRREAFSRDASPSLQSDTGSHGSTADRRREAFSRDASPSLQSDTGSHGSSVDSYLEARKPDPEEVLLGLGFGGSVHAEAEVSRIPARFLQPSKVKGVEIDDFLRYQQDLIETFESGYSGYRGLIGGSQIPSVIVAKIMEKLRERERESSVKSSAGSHHGDLTRRRFSRAVQRVSILTKMKSKDSITSGGPQAHSVLNPDNRKFLDNQGSKSPEMSRKRMIIGHRSFTFDGDGQLIETDVNSGEEGGTRSVPVIKPPPSARPLVHNDSVVSSATSHSLTSYDSDSDIEETSRHLKGTNRGSHLLQRLHSIPAVSSHVSSYARQEYARDQIDYSCSDAFSMRKRRKSLPSAVDTVSNISDGNEGVHVPYAGWMPSTHLYSSTPHKHQTCVGDQQYIPNINTGLSSSFQNNQKGFDCTQDNACLELQSYKPLNETTSAVKVETTSCGIPPNEKMISFKSDMKDTPFNQITDFSLPEDPNLQNYTGSSNSESLNEQHLLKMDSIPKSSAMYLDKITRRKLSLSFSSDSFDISPPVRTQRSLNWSTSSASSWECEASNFCTRGSFSKLKNPLMNTKGNASSSIGSTLIRSPRRGSLKRQQNVDEDDSCAKSAPEPGTSQNIEHLKPWTKNSDKGDSLEMEELKMDKEVPMTFESAHTDNSGFPASAHLCKQLSESEPLLPIQSHDEEQTVEHLKRLSLPVIRIQDESGLLQKRASSLRYNIHTQSLTSSLRRSHSLPTQLSRLGIGGSVSPGSVTDSIGNMFSSCSDDSVIHLPRKCVDVLTEVEQVAAFPLLMAITDNTCEEGTRCATQNCCEQNFSLKKSLAELHGVPFGLNCKQAWTCMNKDLLALQEAQLKIRNVVQHMEGHLCNSLTCGMRTVLEKVSEVAQYQSNICTQLEKISSNAGILPSNTCDFSNSYKSPCAVSGQCTELSSCQLHHSDETCQSLCKVIQEENRRLQDIVQQNALELSRIRKLLQCLLINSKE